MKRIDLTGKKFGLWTVLKPDEKTERTNHFSWICECACGTVKSKDSYTLRKGLSKSCGCHRSINASFSLSKDVSGVVFGRLTAQKIEEIDKKRPGVIWRCLCKCGNICFVNSRDLLGGNVNSCGCLKIETSIKTINRCSKLGTMHNKGEEHPNSILTEEAVMEIRSYFKRIHYGKIVCKAMPEIHMQEIANKYGVSLTCLYNVLQGRTWGWLKQTKNKNTKKLNKRRV